MAYHLGKLVGAMIVCSCNVISDQDIRRAVEAADEAPRNPKQLYGCLGCSPECGRCARTIKTIIDQTLAPSVQAVQAGCQHSHPHDHVCEEEDIGSRFALAAC
jgi:bacterioferritin-associated ferredoxin